MKHRRAIGAVRWVLTAAGVAAVAGIALGLLWLSRPLVTVTQVVEGPVVNSFYATGTVQPVTEYPIKSSNAGTLTRVCVDKGDQVAVDQVLAFVADPQLQYKLDKAKAELEQAAKRADPKQSPVLMEYDAKRDANVAMLENARHEVKRYAEMIDKRAASETDKERAADHVQDLWSQGVSIVQQREAALLQLKTDQAVAQAAVAAAQAEADRQTIRSPIAGVVLDRPTPQGTWLNVNDHIMQVADVHPENLRMRAAVDEENKPELKIGQLVHMSLYAFAGRIFDGHVSRIYDKADPDRRTFEVDVMFEPSLQTSTTGPAVLGPNPDLSAGMTGELAFILSQKKHALIAPSQALQHGELFTLRAGRLIRVEGAKIGIKSVERIEIAAGLRAGDLIVISPVLDVPEGSAVRVKRIDPTLAAGLNKPSADSSRNPLGGN